MWVANAELIKSYFTVGDLITALRMIYQQMLHNSHINPCYESRDQSKQNQWFNDDSDEIYDNNDDNDDDDTLHHHSVTR